MRNEPLALTSFTDRLNYRDVLILTTYWSRRSSPSLSSAAGPNTLSTNSALPADTINTFMTIETLADDGFHNESVEKKTYYDGFFEIRARNVAVWHSNVFKKFTLFPWSLSLGNWPTSWSVVLFDRKYETKRETW